jgi:SMC interacting uncharacterized protein involved in chromosome segregation
MHGQPQAMPSQSASSSKQPVDIPPHIKAEVHAAVQRATPLVMAAWKTTIAEMETSMAQMSASYDRVLNAEIARREASERELGQAIRERETGRKDLQKMWEENQRLFQDAIQIKSLNSDLQRQCAELDTDKKALRAFVDKLLWEKASLTQEVQIFRAEKRNAEAPSVSDIVETVKSALTSQYQDSIASRKSLILVTCLTKRAEFLGLKSLRMHVSSKRFDWKRSVRLPN